MKRGEFITLLGGAPAASLRAQKPTMPLRSGALTELHDRLTALRQVRRSLDAALPRSTAVQSPALNIARR